ncbi:MAG: heparan-alpha-glucosaminide N-acetyltransferase domain-containing protein, partial [Ahrensia sp.]|nr:heparan-alpha-glucosaminide N-acetyltransferase domain-containing protein [Ahrensia sp.]
VVFGNTGANRPFRDLGDGPFMKALVWMGRHSLVIYLVHQPLLLAIIVPVATLVH